MPPTATLGIGMPNSYNTDDLKPFLFGAESKHSTITFSKEEIEYMLSDESNLNIRYNGFELERFKNFGKSFGVDTANFLCFFASALKNVLFAYFAWSSRKKDMEHYERMSIEEKLEMRKKRGNKSLNFSAEEILEIKEEVNSIKYSG